MTYKETRIREQATAEMNRRFPQKELDYRNGIVGTAIAVGKKNELTEDWLKKVLLGDIEDGFITYGQALAVKDEYYKAICEVAKMF